MRGQVSPQSSRMSLRCVWPVQSGTGARLVRVASASSMHDEDGEISSQLLHRTQYGGATLLQSTLTSAKPVSSIVYQHLTRRRLQTRMELLRIAVQHCSTPLDR
jgi:hypothetical protein